MKNSASQGEKDRSHRGVPNPEISVIINTYNRAALLERCLNTLVKQTLSQNRFEVIVIDDGSEDDTEEVAQEFSSSLPLHYRKEPHRGWSAARNRGIALAKAPLVLFLGDDIMVAPELVETHLNCHAEGEPHAVVGDLEYHPRGPSKVFDEFTCAHRFEWIQNPDDASFYFFYTANLSVPTEAVREVGGFDENFVYYSWEDLELGYRLEQRGLKLQYRPEARAVHDHPPMSLDDLCRREFDSYISAYYFYHKHGGRGLEAVRIWGDEEWLTSSGPARKTLGKRLIRFLETFFPNERILRFLYLRLITSYRLAGVMEARRLFASLLKEMREEGKAKESL